MPIIDDITGVIQNVNAKYTFVVEYNKNNNPFLGLYIARLKPETISDFLIKLVINEYEQGNTVYITETKITINTRSPRPLEKLALAFLTFDSHLAEQLTDGNN